MNLYQTSFCFGSVWKGYTNVDNQRMLPNVDPSAWMPFLLPWCTLLRHYMPSPLPSYWLRRLSARQKMNMFIFLRSRIEAESKSNRNCNSRLRALPPACNYAKIFVFHFCCLSYNSDVWQMLLWQLREAELEMEKLGLVRQVEELRGTVAKLSSEKESLNDVSLCVCVCVHVFWAFLLHMNK